MEKFAHKNFCGFIGKLRALCGPSYDVVYLVRDPIIVQDVSLTVKFYLREYRLRLADNFTLEIMIPWWYARE